MTYVVLRIGIGKTLVFSMGWLEYLVEAGLTLDRIRGDVPIPPERSGCRGAPRGSA